MSAIARQVLTVLAVEDLEASTRFYAAAFDWTPSVTTPVYVEFAPEGAPRLGLYQRDGFARTIGRSPVELAAGDVAPSELYFYCEDVAAVAERVRAAGGVELSPLGPRDWGDEAAYFAGPSGHIVVIARPLD